MLSKRQIYLEQSLEAYLAVGTLQPQDYRFLYVETHQRHGEISPCCDMFATRELKCLAKMSLRNVVRCLRNVCDEKFSKKWKLCL